MSDAKSLARRACHDDALAALEEHVSKCWQCKREFRPLRISEEEIMPIFFKCSCVMALCNQCARVNLGKASQTYHFGSDGSTPFVTCPKCIIVKAAYEDVGVSFVSNQLEDEAAEEEEEELLRGLPALLGLGPLPSTKATKTTNRSKTKGETQNVIKAHLNAYTPFF